MAVTCRYYSSSCKLGKTSFLFILCVLWFDISLTTWRNARFFAPPPVRLRRTGMAMRGPRLLTLVLLAINPASSEETTQQVEVEPLAGSVDELQRALSGSKAPKASTINVLRRGLAANPRDAKLHAALGLAQARSKGKAAQKEAIKHLRATLEIEPQFAGVHRALALKLQEQTHDGTADARRWARNEAISLFKLALRLSKGEGEEDADADSSVGGQLVCLAARRGVLTTAGTFASGTSNSARSMSSRMTLPPPVHTRASS